MTPEYDMHVHTIFSGHAHESATAARLAVKAAALQMKLLCFSEHVFDPASLRTLEDLRWQIGSLQRNNPCRLVVGGEFDVDPHRCDGSLVATPPPWVEFVTASMHYLPGTDIYPQGSLADYHFDRREFLDKWSRTVLGVAANPIVDMVGHPGVLVGILLEDYPDEVMETLRKAAILSASHGQCWDFNELAFDKLAKVSCDYRLIMQLAVDNGVTLLYGSDAHSVHSLGRTVNVVAALEQMHGLTLERLFRLPDFLKKRFRLPL